MKSKTILITGASRGIGRACALTFAKAGYQVFINCKTRIDELELVKKQICEIGSNCITVTGDVSNPAQVKKIFSQIETHCDGLDVLINNAGISHIGLFHGMSDEQWQDVLNTNLSSAFYCARSAIPYMLQQKQGKIIHISSIWGNVGASCEVAYSASKAGLNGLTKALAKELAPSNIQVNAIGCGIIETSMNQCFSTEETKTMLTEIPAGRFGKPEEVALLALDLAEKHNYLTGQIIGLDGGY
ncbi:MAG: 3-oxoacyl-ACP reductase FabG [Lachnospiraceae bacterium]|nr:3-oxoacyl-ACP reductase FabG [Lachnospiraceae bacterium]